MNRKPEHGGCWYCMTDFDSDLGCYDSIEFDTVIHVECLEYEFNENQVNANKDIYEQNEELNIFLKEFGYIE